MTPVTGGEGAANSGSADAPLPRGASIAVLGLGLIGGSLALSLRRACRDWRIAGYDADAETSRAALDAGAVDAAPADAASAVRGADLVVLAVPVTATVPLVRSIAPVLRSGALHTVVTDVGSVKSLLVGECEHVLGGAFVGGHPMAGSERSGFHAARLELFDGAPWLLTPTSRTSDAALRTARALALACGARPLVCEPELHDRLVAAVSHLPHLLAYGLAQVASDSVPDLWTGIAAGSFRDGTRVAKSAPDLWTDILLANREAVLASIGAHTAWLDRARAALAADDREALRGVLAGAHEARRRFPDGGDG